MADESQSRAGTKPGPWKRVGLGCLALVVVAALGLVGLGVSMHEPRPSTGTTGEAAEALASRVEAAVGMEDWERTKAVRWTFEPTGTMHLWDRERNLSRVRWGDVEVLVDLDHPRRGVARRAGAPVDAEESRALVRTSWERFCNDSFWMGAHFKLHDPGTTRSVVQVEGQDALLIEYASGGATPGDAYLWLLSEDGTPRAWRMWVSVLPIGGAEVSWEGWTTLATGARIAQHHMGGPADVQITDVEGAATLEELELGEDPFAALLALPD